MTRDHAYWRSAALRVRARNEKESRDSMRVMTPREKYDHVIRSWRDANFPFCARCDTNSSGYHVCHFCDWKKR